jgi:hypothetical protein
MLTEHACVYVESQSAGELAYTRLSAAEIDAKARGRDRRRAA